MKKIVMLLALVLSLFGAEYEVDYKASKVGFHATKMGFIGVDGEFKDFAGHVEVQDSDIAAIVGTIDTRSLTTGNGMRDANLKSEGFFNVTNYPVMTFRSTKVTPKTIEGVLTIKGISKPIVLEVDSMKLEDKSLHVKASTTIDRFLFNLAGSMSFVISDEVELFIDLEANKK